MEIFDSFDVNGKTYRGRFPLYSYETACQTESISDYQNQIANDLIETDEGSTVNYLDQTN